MPKTLINEIDNTSGASTSSLSNTVYIPCGIVQTIIKKVGDVDTNFNFESLDEGHTEEELLPHLLKTKEDLYAPEESFGAKYTYTYEESGEEVKLTEIVPVAPQHKESFALAEHLLANGCFVLLQIVTEDAQESWRKRFVELRDKGLYDPKFICLGEFAGVGQFSIADVIECAEKRGDCIALIDHPREISVSETILASDSYATKVHKWIELNAVSSYVATFSPWCSNTMYNTGTKAAPVYPMLPPSFSFLATYANSVKTNPNWLSAAGAFRGNIPGFVKAEVKYGEKDIDILQCRVTKYTGDHEEFDDADNIGVACNPICNIEPFGVIIWGNRTALKNTVEGLKATSFLNVRNLACDIKKTMWKAARRYTFEQNTLRLWLNFCSQIRPLLDQAKVGEGISSYKFIQEETSAKARLKARIVIVPIEAVEDFELSFVLDDTIETEESLG